MMRSQEVKEECEQMVRPAIAVDAGTEWSPVEWRLGQKEGGNMLNAKVPPTWSPKQTHEHGWRSCFSFFLLLAAANLCNSIKSLYFKPLIWPGKEYYDDHVVN